MASTYLLGPATKEFNVTFQFAGYVDGDPVDHVVTVSGFQDETWVPTIGDNIDPPGYAPIRVP